MLFHSIATCALPLILSSLPSVLGRDLVPIRPNGGKKRDASALNLKNMETFLWGDSSNLHPPYVACYTC